MDKQLAWLRVGAVAQSYERFTELPPGSNRGQVVDRFCSFMGVPLGTSWCACFVGYAGYYGLYDPDTRTSAWPVLKTAGCQALGYWAKSKGVLVNSPQVGDIFLIYYPTLSRFAHTGFVTGQNPDGTWKILAGNTSLPGDTDPDTAREGWGLFSKNRHFVPEDRFIRWTNLV